MEAQYTPGPWEYVPSNENHGAYVTGPLGGDICDCYVMSRPGSPSSLNGGPSKPIPFQGEMADANARLIAAAPELLKALKAMVLNDRHTYRDCHKAALAAIAKATGEA